jgi:hypothetical protein
MVLTSSQRSTRNLSFIPLSWDVADAALFVEDLT